MAVEISTAVWSGSRRFRNGKLLVLLRMADWANIEGVCWPSILKLARMCRMTDRQTQRIVRELETEGVLVVHNRGEKHETNVYQIVVEKLSETKGDIFDKGDIGGGGRVTLEAETMSKMSPHPLVPVIEPSTEESALKEEAKKFVEWFKTELLATGAKVPTLTEAGLNSWADSYEKLVRIDGRAKEEIVKVCRWARRDSFWSANFLAPTKLRNRNKEGVAYFDVFINRMDHATAQKPNGRSLGANSNVSAYEEYDRRMAAGV